MDATGRRGDKTVAMPALEYLLRLPVPGLATPARVVVSFFIVIEMPLVPVMGLSV
jgi:hypothetical protein